MSKKTTIHRDTTRQYRVTSASLNEWVYLVTASSNEEAEAKLQGYVGIEDNDRLPDGVEYAKPGHQNGEIQYVFAEEL
jgi:hypothetical protein